MRTLNADSFDEWGWFLETHKQSSNIDTYYVEYEEFHFGVVKDSGDTEQVLAFLQEHPNGKHYQTVLTTYNGLLIDQCRDRYDSTLQSRVPFNAEYSGLLFWSISASHRCIEGKYRLV